MESEEINMKENIKQLAAWYNTWGYESPFCREAEKKLVNNDKKSIEEAKELAAMARQDASKPKRVRHEQQR